MVPPLYGYRQLRFSKFCKNTFYSPQIRTICIMRYICYGKGLHL